MKKLFVTLIALVVIVPSLSVKTAHAQVSDTPTWIYAPSIGLFSPVQGVGTTPQGAMAVPSGSSNKVGWYKDGVLPGDTGTAVLDAHVFAAFKNLAKVKPGEYIYMFMASGKILSFQVKAANLYATKTLSPYTLFAPAASPKLNLITCAGSLTADRTTYDHRLIISAELV